MGRIYLGIYYLKILHYFFFALAVFTLTTGTMFFESFTLESLNFFLLCAVYFVTSLYTAFLLYRSYTKLATPIIVVKTYLLPYPILALWVFAMTLFLIYIFPSLAGLVFSFLFVNYYIVFLLVLGVLIGRFGVARRLFEFYNTFNLKRAQVIASKYSRVIEVKGYEIGSDPKADEILDDIWKHKDYPLAQVKKLEARLCEIEITKINKSIEILERWKERSNEEDKLLKRLKKEKLEYIKKIDKIQELSD